MSKSHLYILTVFSPSLVYSLLLPACMTIIPNINLTMQKSIYEEFSFTNFFIREVIE